MKNIKKIIAIAFLYIIGVCSFSLTTEAAVGYTYKVNKPENQRNEEVGYFDLRMTPSQKQTVTIDLTNESDKEVVAVVSLNGAKTSGNGVIEYGPIAIDNDKSLKYDFKDIVKGPEKVVLPAKTTVPLKLDITMPEATFDGVISGGIELKTEADEKERAKQKGVINDYAYVIGMLLSETDTVVKPELELNSVGAGLSNYRNSIFVNFSNTKAAYLEELTMDVQITQKGSEAVLYDAKKANMRVAPNSMVDFPVSLNGEKMVPGDYKAYIVASTKDKKWTWEEDFTITDEEADKYNDQDVNLVQEQGINWKLIAVIAGSVIVVAIIIFVVVRLVLSSKKNKKKKNRKKK
ncbi:MULTISPECIES: DUF916 and DUF3324 domain-containing protein [unclassified Enterococcus]|uniref:DUF916 and DUF3324 domain-containing protein n=1 Tax=unclassified Enterococcus TaxID=2608891 RepID=UPI001CE10422|nr:MULTISPECIES: DUF916 and DUF3324 domain-containing protein [unclassified Enterococcus]MCA5013658.1 DUF916 and DUF3324 domain-containing protein [Enterococcus sp. S23]MCA5016908.1 DUF916 and DUF3324 domain-containing protein [Enterococcus sp. S22(2020)]